MGTGTDALSVSVVCSNRQKKGLHQTAFALLETKASPKAISERTSYLRVRLEFLRYPHLIRYHFNGSRFGPPWSFTSTSTWTWVGHTVSGRIHLTSRPIQTRFRFGSRPEALNLARYIHSPDHSTKGTRSPLDGLSVLVSTRFQVLFHSPPGVLFTFPSQYSSLSVTR